jgi:RHS repeat-associated protein
VKYWPHGGMLSYLLGNGVSHRSSFNHNLQLSEGYDAIGNDSARVLFVSCPNWGDSFNPSVLDLCPHPAASSTNGTLKSYFQAHGGPGYNNLLSLNQEFTYDSLNRLASVSDSGGFTRSYSYDAFGNMSVIAASGLNPSPLTPYSANGFDPYNSSNQLKAGQYDQAGNQTLLGAVQFAYDAENRQVRAQDGPASNPISFTYDGEGRRVMEDSADHGRTVYVFDAFGVLAAEYSNSAGDLPCNVCYVSTDHLGSVRLVMDETGVVVGRHDYLPFGEELRADSPGRDSQFDQSDGVEERFSGKQRDPHLTSHLDYFGARYYASLLGRFTSPDPENAGADLLNPQSWNGYSYALNNPLGLVDLTGMASCAPGTYSTCVDVVDSTSPIAPESWNAFVQFWRYFRFGPDALAINQSGPEAKPGIQLTTKGGARPAKSVPQKVACAAQFGNDHSVAALFGGGKVAMFFGGNTVSSLMNLGLAVTGNGPAPQNPGTIALSGYALGLPVNDALRLAGRQTFPQLTSASGFVRGQVLQTVFKAATGPSSVTTLAGETALQGGATAGEYASGIAVAKFVFDGATFLYGYFGACQ